MPIIIALILVPLGFISPFNVHEGHRFALAIAAVSISAWRLPVLLRAFFVYLSVWVLWLFIAWALLGMATDHATIEAFRICLFFIMAAVVVSHIIYCKTPDRWFFNAICSVAVFQGLLCIAQLFQIDPVRMFLELFVETSSELGPGVITGTLGNNNFVSAFLAISLVFFFRRGWVWLLPVVVVPIALSQTSTAVIGATAAAVVLLSSERTKFIFFLSLQERWPVFFLHWKQFAGSLLVVACLYFMFFVDSRPVHRSKRWYNWAIAWERITLCWQGFLFGWGPGAHWGGKSAQLHSEWLWGLHQYGLIGMSLVIGHLAGAIRGYMAHTMLFSAFVAACLIAAGSDPLHYPPTGLLILTVFGLLERKRWQTSSHF